MFCGAHVRGLLSRLDPLTFFHIWFLQNQIFQFCPLDFDRKNVHACTSNIHQDGDSKEAAAKGTSPGGDPIGKAKNSKTRKKGGYAKKKHRNPQKARKNSGDTEVANTAKKRKCRSCRAYPIGRARIWTTRRTASANRSAQLDRTRKCPPPRIEEPAISLTKMRQVHQEDGAHNQQVAAELQTSVNEASAQLVITDAALKRKWEAEQDDEERERLKNEFFHVRSILRTMTEDRGLAGAHVFAAE